MTSHKILHGLLIVHGISGIIAAALMFLSPERLTDQLYPAGSDPADFTYPLGIVAGYSLMGAAMNFLQSIGMRKQEKNALFLGFLAGANQIWSAVFHTINENWLATGLGYFFGIGILIFSYIAWKNWQ